MKFTNLIIGCLIFIFQFTPIARAAELIISHDELNELERRSRENHYQLKHGPISLEISTSQLGKTVTPFFKDPSNDTSKRRYQNEKKCFEVNFLKTVNITKKINCADIISDIHIPGMPEFTAIKLSDLLKSGIYGFKFQSSQSQYLLKAYLHTYETVDLDSRILGLKNFNEFPSQNFTLQIQNDGNVIAGDKNGIYIEQFQKIKIDKIGIQDEVTYSRFAQTRVYPSEIVFYNGNGTVILVNKLNAPAPFQNYFLEPVPFTDTYLKNLEIKSVHEPVCFRNNLMSPSKLDCKQVLIQYTPFVKFKNYKLLKIDFKNQSVLAI